MYTFPESWNREGITMNRLYLEDIDFDEKEDPVIREILNFLASGKYPGRLTPDLAGFVVCFADKESQLYETGCCAVKEAYDQLVFGSIKNDGNMIRRYELMLNFLKKAEKTDLVDLLVLETRIRCKMQFGQE